MVVSPDHKKRFEDAVAKYYPITKGINCSQRIRYLGLFIRPEFLDKASIRYLLILQQPGDLIITFAGAYHQGFNAGANMAEAVNYAWTGWTPKAVECVRGQCGLEEHDPLLLEGFQICRSQDLEQIWESEGEEEGSVADITDSVEKSGEKEASKEEASKRERYRIDRV
jgi:hypothetical protein